MGELLLKLPLYSLTVSSLRLLKTYSLNYTLWCLAMQIIKYNLHSFKNSQGMRFLQPTLQMEVICMLFITAFKTTFKKFPIQQHLFQKN